MKMGLKKKLYNVKKVLEHAIDGHATTRNIMKRQQSFNVHAHAPPPHLLGLVLLIHLT
jgi:hypothetical protein